MTYAPILLFTYNRLTHTQHCIESLQQNLLAPDSELFIYSDAAKTKEQEDEVHAVRSYLHTIQGFKQITIIERKENSSLVYELQFNQNVSSGKWDRFCGAYEEFPYAEKICRSLWAQGWEEI